MDQKEFQHSIIDFEPGTAANMWYSRTVMYKDGAIVSSLRRKSIINTKSGAN